MTVPTVTDEVLMQRVAERDSNALAALYDRYARTVYTFAVHVAGQADAEEIVQDVFLRVWSRAGQFNAAHGTFSTWCMTITRHRLVDRARWFKRRQVIAATAIDALLAEPADPDMNVETQTEARLQGAAILNALSTLPKEQRAVLVLGYFGGLSQSGIASQLGVPIGTVKKRVRLGLTKLRALLTGTTCEDEHAGSRVP